MIDKIILLRALELEKSTQAKPLTAEVLLNCCLYNSYMDVIRDLGFKKAYEEFKRREECQEES